MSVGRIEGSALPVRRQRVRKVVQQRPAGRRRGGVPVLALVIGGAAERAGRLEEPRQPKPARDTRRGQAGSGAPGQQSPAPPRGADRAPARQVESPGVRQASTGRGESPATRQAPAGRGESPGVRQASAGRIANAGLDASRADLLRAGVSRADVLRADMRRLEAARSESRRFAARSHAEQEAARLESRRLAGRSHAEPVTVQSEQELAVRSHAGQVVARSERGHAARSQPGQVRRARPGAEMARRPTSRGATQYAPVRLTRRGKVVAQLVLIAAALIAAAGVVAGARAAGDSAEPQGPRPTVVVHEGDTLWNIAERHAPGVDRRAVIAEIRRLNDLDGAKVEVGQQLVLPRR